jgi:hypothetical protein
MTDGEWIEHLFKELLSRKARDPGFLSCRQNGADWISFAQDEAGRAAPKMARKGFFWICVLVPGKCVVPI